MDEVRVMFPKFHDISYLLSKQPLEDTAHDFDSLEELQTPMSVITCILRRCQQALQDGVSQCQELAFVA